MTSNREHLEPKWNAATDGNGVGGEQGKRKERRQMVKVGTESPKARGQITIRRQTKKVGENDNKPPPNQNVGGPGTIDLGTFLNAAYLKTSREGDGVSVSVKRKQKKKNNDDRLKAVVPEARTPPDSGDGPGAWAAAVLKNVLPHNITRQLPQRSGVSIGSKETTVEEARETTVEDNSHETADERTCSLEVGNDFVGGHSVESSTIVSSKRTIGTQRTQVKDAGSQTDFNAKPRINSRMGRRNKGKKPQNSKKTKSRSTSRKKEDSEPKVENPLENAFRARMEHYSGNCKPCNYFWASGGCLNGSGCKFCHICPPYTKKWRKKLRDNGRKNWLRAYYPELVKNYSATVGGMCFPCDMPASLSAPLSRPLDGQTPNSANNGLPPVFLPVYVVPQESKTASEEKQDSKDTEVNEDEANEQSKEQSTESASATRLNANAKEFVPSATPVLSGGPWLGGAASSGSSGPLNIPVLGPTPFMFRTVALGSGTKSALPSLGGLYKPTNNALGGSTVIPNPLSGTAEQAAAGHFSNLKNLLAASTGGPLGGVPSMSGHPTPRTGEGASSSSEAE